MATALLDSHDHEARIARTGICSVCIAAESAGVEVVPESQAGVQHDLFGALDGQVGQVLEVLQDGRWHTLRQMAGELEIPEQSVSARIRDLRKPHFGRHTIERRKVAGHPPIFQYRLAR